MIHFVLVFDRKRATVLERVEFPAGARDLAWSARDALDRKYAATPDVEVVLLGAASEADLRATHGRYFQNAMPPAA